MKKFTHAWLAMMAMKRIEKAVIPERQKDDAVALVKWFKNYRDFVISGAWYPDEVIKDMSPSHITKFKPDNSSKDVSFRLMPPTLGLYQHGLTSRLMDKPFTITIGNLCDRCEALTHALIDNFKILYYEGVGSPISPVNNHIAMRFFMLSHYIADAHMPLHCDARQFATPKNPNQVHAYIEEQWDNMVDRSYEIDIDNNRFFYDPEGYPLKKDMQPIIQYVEDELARREFIWAWGPDPKEGEKKQKCKNTWDYMSGITQYSYLMAYDMIPDDTDPMNITPAYYRESAAYKEHFEEYSKIILSDAVESIAKVWLHAWVRYRDWWRGCELASLKATADAAEKDLESAKKTINSDEEETLKLKEKITKCEDTLAKKQKSFDDLAAKGKDTTKAQEQLTKAIAALKTAKDKLQIHKDDVAEAKASLSTLQAIYDVKKREHNLRIKEYAKYVDKNSVI